jgi:crossover junction endodeoxyribonuclease RuvC
VVVLGIDPGSRRCGYGVVARSGGRLARLESGVIVLGQRPMPERLALLLEGIAAVLARSRVDAVAVETAFCGLSPRSALALGQSRGVALAVAARAGVPVFEYAPAEVKRAFTGSGRAEKAQMVRTATVLFGVAAKMPDEADALAIAVCHLARRLGAGSARSSGGRAEVATTRPGRRPRARGRAEGESDRGATVMAGLSGTKPPTSKRAEPAARFAPKAQPPALRPAIRRFAEMP